MSYGSRIFVGAIVGEEAEQRGLGQGLRTLALDQREVRQVHAHEHVRRRDLRRGDAPRARLRDVHAEGPGPATM